MFLLPLFACDFEEEEACSTIAIASTEVSFLDEGGTPIPDATVTWSLDGVEKGACEAWPDGGWVCGWDAPGHIVVTAEAPGWEPATGEADVALDGCHVATEQILIVSRAREVPCDDIAWASISVTLSGSSGEDLENPVVQYRSADVDDAPWQACEPSDETTWLCGWEEAGSFDVMGTADGHTTAYALVEVPLTEDECHVVTQEADLVVEWLPD